MHPRILFYFIHFKITYNKIRKEVKKMEKKVESQVIYNGKIILRTKGEGTITKTWLELKHDYISLQREVQMKPPSDLCGYLLLMDFE